MIWHHEKLLPFTTATKSLQILPPHSTPSSTIIEKDNDDNGNGNGNNNDKISSQNNRLRMSNFIFNNVISSRFMVMMEGKDERSFEVYGDFLVELIRERFVTMEYVNELSIGLYQNEWRKVCIKLFLLLPLKFTNYSARNFPSDFFIIVV